MNTYNFNFSFSWDIPRLCFCEMPILEKSVADAFRYNADSDIAVIIPVFFSKHIGKYDSASEFLLHGFMKRAMWQAYELLNFTDLRAQGISYYIVAEETIKGQFRPYLDACEFPRDHVIWSTESTESYPGHLIKFPFMREVLREKNINKVLVFDSAVYFVKARANQVFARIQESWKHAPIVNLTDVWKGARRGISNDRVISYEDAVCRYPLTETLSEEIYYDQVSTAVGYSVEFLKGLGTPQAPIYIPNIEGRVQGFQRAVLETPEFWNLLETLKELTWNDQAVTALYWLKYLGQENDILVPPGVEWYPKHPFDITEGNIGFLDSSKSVGSEARKKWIERCEILQEVTHL